MECQLSEQIILVREDKIMKKKKKRKVNMNYSYHEDGLTQNVVKITVTSNKNVQLQLNKD